MTRPLHRRVVLLERKSARAAPTLCDLTDAELGAQLARLTGKLRHEMPAHIQEVADQADYWNNADDLETVTAWVRQLFADDARQGRV